MSEAGRERERRVQIMRLLGETARPTDGRIDDHLNIGRSLRRRTMIRATCMRLLGLLSPAISDIKRQRTFICF